MRKRKGKGEGRLSQHTEEAMTSYEVHRSRHYEGSGKRRPVLGSEGNEPWEDWSVPSKTSSPGVQQGKQQQPKVMRAVQAVCTGLWRQPASGRSEEALEDETLGVVHEG